MALQLVQFLESHGFLDYLERGLGSDENNCNLLNKLQDAIGRGQNPMSIFPSPTEEPEIITISDPGLGIPGNYKISINKDHRCWIIILKKLKVGCVMFWLQFWFNHSGSGVKYCYNRFPLNSRSEEQDEKRKQILAAASGALELAGKHPPRYKLRNFECFCCNIFWTTKEYCLVICWIPDFSVHRLFLWVMIPKQKVSVQEKGL